MAKKKAKKRKARARPSLFTQPAGELGRTVEVSVKKAIEGESVFTLSDGTSVHARVVPTSITRSLDKYNANGDPVYAVQAGVLLRTVVPKKLKRKIPS